MGVLQWLMCSHSFTNIHAYILGMGVHMHITYIHKCVCVRVYLFLEWLISSQWNILEKMNINVELKNINK
jgi:hypothetical protein